MRSTYDCRNAGPFCIWSVQYQTERNLRYWKRTVTVPVPKNRVSSDTFLDCQHFFVMKNLNIHMFKVI
jgi:hypothetical protein